MDNKDLIFDSPDHQRSRKSKSVINIEREVHYQSRAMQSAVPAPQMDAEANQI